MRALITGVTGQDGSYLAEQLAAAGHDVAGLVHGQEEPKWGWVQDLVPRLHLIQGDLLDLGCTCGVIAKSGAWLLYGDTKLGQGKENARKFLIENGSMTKEIADKILVAIGVKEK